MATWEASPEPQRPPLVKLANETVRMVAHVSLGGIFIRVRLSNEFGDKPLTIGAAHLGLSAGTGGGVQPGSDRTVTFGHQPTITIPPGARVLSDPVSLTVPSQADVVVSLYFPGDVGAVTEHYFGLQTSRLAPGDNTAALEFPSAETITKQVILTGLDVSAASGTKTVVALGDSLTGGFGSTMDANRRWPDDFSARVLGPKGLSKLSVVNAGISGNRLLHDFFGPNALSRFDRDVLSQPNVGYLVVELGINDLGLPGGRNLPEEEVSADDMIAGFRQLIVRANSYGIKVFFGTIPPFAGFTERPGFYSDAAEIKREAINDWIRTNTEAQGYIDFEAALRDPDNPRRLNPRYDSGDHLDPNDAGYQAMADAIEFRLFE
ncbi:MAG TPA: SGNH/GDSL hydrolase family protein [Caulobacteraceae bacterium]|nr:SGNH/GDSL hydrolase family protein [Caulobacteraceae bacterium]